MDFVLAANESQSTLYPGESENGDSSWETKSWMLMLVGVVATVFGLIGNYFCFVTAGFLPESTSANLIKYLAVWDSIAVLQDGIVNLGFKLPNFDLSGIHVSYEVTSEAVG